MIKLYYYMNQIMQHLDPRVSELEKDLEFFQMLLWGLGIVLVLLIIIVVIQRRTISDIRKGKPARSFRKPFSRKGAAAKASSSPSITAPKELPDPGLIFKYSLAQEKTLEKMIAIGQTEGNIKTFSTEIIDNHLALSIRIIENRRDKDIYDLPDKVVEEYMLDMRRDGKALIYFTGLEKFREMGSKERIYIKPDPDETGETTFKDLDPREPIRVRLGDRLNQDNKFRNGFFEFHIFTKDYQVATKAGIPKIEKYFFIRLYKIYPGYDTGSPTSDGLYPMIDPFTTG